MTKLDLLNNLKFTRGLSPAAAVTDNTAQVTQIIDMQGHKGCLFAVLLGAIADAGITTTFLVEDGNDSGLSDAAAVADIDLISDALEADAEFDQDDDNKVRVIQYIGLKRFARLTVTPAGNAADIFIAILAILGQTEQKPVTQNT